MAAEWTFSLGTGLPPPPKMIVTDPQIDPRFTMPISNHFPPNTPQTQPAQFVQSTQFGTQLPVQNSHLLPPTLSLPQQTHLQVLNPDLSSLNSHNITTPDVNTTPNGLTFLTPPPLPLLVPPVGLGAQTLPEVPRRAKAHEKMKPGHAKPAPRKKRKPQTTRTWLSDEEIIDHIRDRAEHEHVSVQSVRDRLHVGYKRAKRLVDLVYEQELNMDSATRQKYVKTCKHLRKKTKIPTYAKPTTRYIPPASVSPDPRRARIVRPRSEPISYPVTMLPNYTHQPNSFSSVNSSCNLFSGETSRQMNSSQAAALPAPLQVNLQLNTQNSLYQPTLQTLQMGNMLNSPPPPPLVNPSSVTSVAICPNLSICPSTSAPTPQVQSLSSNLCTLSGNSSISLVEDIHQKSDSVPGSEVVTDSEVVTRLIFEESQRHQDLVLQDVGLFDRREGYFSVEAVEPGVIVIKDCMTHPNAPLYRVRVPQAISSQIVVGWKMCLWVAKPQHSEEYCITGAGSVFPN